MYDPEGDGTGDVRPEVEAAIRRYIERRRDER
jgi:hypothetical protein